MGIIIVGSLNYDLVTYTDRIPDAGETFRANSFETHAGGKGLNQTIAIANLRHTDMKYTVRMIGSVGDDSFGEQLLELLSKRHVNVSALRTMKNERTGTATIIVEELNGGQNRILLSEGANGKSMYTAEELSGLFNKIEQEEKFDEKHYVVLQHEIPDPASIILWLKKNRPIYEIIFNPSPFKRLEREVWMSVDLLIVNEVEALQIVKSLYAAKDVESLVNDIRVNFVSGYQKICEDLQKNLICQSNSNAVVITLGSKGALFSCKQDPVVRHIPAIDNIKIVDTTGAGDTFLGGLVTQLYQGSTLDEAIGFSTSASSLTIQQKGAAESIPTFSKVINHRANFL